MYRYVRRGPSTELEFNVLKLTKQREKHVYLRCNVEFLTCIHNFSLSVWVCQWILNGLDRMLGERI